MFFFLFGVGPGYNKILASQYVSQNPLSGSPGGLSIFLYENGILSVIIYLILIFKMFKINNKLNILENNIYWKTVVLSYYVLIILFFLVDYIHNYGHEIFLFYSG